MHVNLDDHQIDHVKKLHDCVFVHPFKVQTCQHGKKEEEFRECWMKPIARKLNCMYYKVSE